MGKIKTGVDRLVELIAREKKISIDDAARKLGISKVVIQEWADFLEEEKLISIEYKFSKTFLTERKLSEEEVKVKEREFASEKDAFVRKVESSLKGLEKDNLGLQRVKEEFEAIKKDIGRDLDKVRNEVKELEKYEYLKKNLDKDIEKQVAEFHEILEKAHKELDFEQKRQQELLSEVEVEKREIQLKEHRLLTLEEKEKELIKRMRELVLLSKELENNIDAEKSSLGESEKKILEMTKSVKEIEKMVLNKKETIQPLVDRARKHEEQILKLQDEILQRAREKTATLKGKVEDGNKALTNFQRFFDKKAEVETMISNMEKEKRELEQSFIQLQKKAIAFDLVSKGSTVNIHMGELEKSLDEVNKRKSAFKEDLERLIKLIKG